MILLINVISIQRKNFPDLTTPHFIVVTTEHYILKCYPNFELLIIKLYRKLFKLPPRCSASLMSAENNVPNFEALIRGENCSFIVRLSESNYELIKTLHSNNTCRYVLWNKWQQ